MDKADSVQLQGLLRFLSQDAKLPLSVAMGKVKGLQNASLMTPDSISKATVKDLQPVFTDEKVARQVHNAAKRLTKKRAAPLEAEEHTSKRNKKSSAESYESISSAEFEASVELPYSDASVEDLSKVRVFTNRAPLVLAFVVTLLKYTMPEQPTSSRLSLAQAYVSVSSRSRAVDLGIEKGASAEEDGWGAGQPSVKIMGKSIRVMRRSGHETIESSPGQNLRGEESFQSEEIEAKTAFWGLNLEALRKSNTSSNEAGGRSNDVPIYTAQSARSYLLKAAAPIPEDAGNKPKKKNSTAARVEETEKNLGMLLKAIDLVFQSWLPEIGPTGLDGTSWSWYAKVRPDINQGREGWGEKNEVKLQKILDLRK